MRILQGTISGLKMAKTVTVTITRYKKHPKYQKRFRVTKKYHAHCEDELRKDLKVGDSVYILESKPLSKLKRWTLVTEESRKALIEKDRGTQASKASKKTEIKNISNKQSITLEHGKRKMNSNKRKVLAAAAPAPAPSPAPVAEPVAEKAVEESKPDKEIKEKPVEAVESKEKEKPAEEKAAKPEEKAPAEAAEKPSK